MSSRLYMLQSTSDGRRTRRIYCLALFQAIAVTIGARVTELITRDLLSLNFPLAF